MSQKITIWVARIGFIMFIVGFFSSTLTSAWLDFKWLMYIHADKVGHILSMLLLTSASLIALPTVRTLWLFSGAISIALGIELVQLFGPRSADIVDFAASLVGIFFAAIFYHTADIRRWLRRVRPNAMV